MLKELVVNAAPHETRVAVLENGNIAELFIERGDETNITGNIYKGRVQRVLPGMQAAFVDIGLNQAAFLYVDDILDDTSDEIAKRFEQESELEMELELDGDENQEATEQDINEGEITTGSNWKSCATSECPIEDLITEGQEILVQVAKSPIGSKGPRVTTHISLPGRFMVLMPTVDHIGISRRIDNDRERGRLKELLLSVRRDNYGYILRTAAEGIQEERLRREIEFLNKTWEDIQKKNKKASAPSLVYRDLTVTFRAVRDLLTDEADKLIIDSRAGYENVLEFLEKLMPDLKVSVELYTGMEPIFDAYNIEGDIARALKKKVWLKSGGYIVIEQTEALVAIDVNTGRYVGKHNFEETILKTNLEAVKEIAYQIRLRNIGGIIIIDFIDMKKSQHKEKVMTQLNEALKKDKSQTNVLPLSELGLVQMTRKRVRRNLTRTLCEPCFYCGGDGMLLSGKSICHKIYRDLINEATDMMGNRFTVKVHPEIAQLLHGEEKHLVSSLENRFGTPIAIYPEPHYHIEEYHIFESLA
ncbi:Ribonuclease G [Desulfamplus magnetovallimortis]|uniref:Ribonuclease G n=1 Tax=Desulfamplus magnetovallimortis TaxID=1246637 RepID=A0A1W1HB47_9BACT|nr:Rne/Rng family ribonuclease [Desulfamplus magnetovallimortis]SLM29707.1 Ribonuclease G [Desulfamplus magnetovallimortis]